jgi:hypothetical protein
MNSKPIYFALLLVSLTFFMACGDEVAPVSERIAKVWTAASVKEGSTEVYKVGATTNTKPGYASYRLDLSTPPSVTIKDVDGGNYSGKYTIIGDKTLSITGLSPEPTGTGGTLEFTITTLDDASLILTATKSYPKTGNTLNVYTLKSN